MIKIIAIVDVLVNPPLDCQQKHRKEEKEDGYNKNIGKRNQTDERKSQGN